MPRIPYIVPPDPQPRWVNAEHSMLDVRIIFPSLSAEPGVQTCAASDPGWEHTEEIFARAVAGEFGPIAPYVPPPLPVPAAITRRQCARELFERGLITGPEMVAMAQFGTPPESVAASFDAITPDADRYRAFSDFAADTYDRSNQAYWKAMSVLAPGDAHDDFFRAAATR
ncbi:MAG: hypothetical protein INF10_06180 [Methylobacterium sp.]|nr:hypothetical protein [Methylobacterium sp.]MCA3675500.1 hypothetical protein [Methylobacterium sp.]